MTKPSRTKLAWPSIEDRLDSTPYSLLGYYELEAEKHVDQTERAFPKAPPQGGLFAYMFRRFGPPNADSDPYKNLASWNLDIGLEDAWLRVTPSGSDMGSLSFDLMVHHDVIDARRTYIHARMADWSDEQIAFEAFLKKHDMRPRWANAKGSPDLVDALNERMPAEAPTVAFLKAANSRLPQADARRDTAHKLILAFCHSPDCPSYHEPASPEEWDEDHPMKPYLMATLATLQDLTRPVEMADYHIDPYGKVDDDDVDYDETVAPFGGEGFTLPKPAHEAPDYAEAAIKKVAALGDGDLKAGYEALQRLLEQAEDLKPSSGGFKP